MSETNREYAANYRKPPEHTRFKKGQSGNPRGRSAKNLPALLAAALNENVTVTENGKRGQITKREGVSAQVDEVGRLVPLGVVETEPAGARPKRALADPAPHAVLEHPVLSLVTHRTRAPLTLSFREMELTN